MLREEFIRNQSISLKDSLLGILPRISEVLDYEMSDSKFPIKMIKREEDLELLVSVPGGSKTDFNLLVEATKIYIQYTPPEDSENIFIAPFKYQIYIGESYNIDQATAKMDKGILSIKIPVLDKYLPKKIEIMD